MRRSMTEAVCMTNIRIRQQWNNWWIRPISEPDGRSRRTGVGRCSQVCSMMKYAIGGIGAEILSRGFIQGEARGGTGRPL